MPFAIIKITYPCNLLFLLSLVSSLHSLFEQLNQDLRFWHDHNHLKGDFLVSYLYKERHKDNKWTQNNITTFQFIICLHEITFWFCSMELWELWFAWKWICRSRYNVLKQLKKNVQVKHINYWINHTSTPFDAVVTKRWASLVSLDHVNCLKCLKREVWPSLQLHNILTVFRFAHLQCVSQNFWQKVSEVRLKFLKSATNLAISLRSCLSTRELQNEVVNFAPHYVGKLRCSLRAKFASFSVVGLVI